MALLIGVTATAPRLASAATSSSAAKANTLSITAVTEISSTLHKFSDPNHSATASFWLAPGVRISENYKLSGLFIFDKELTDKRENNLRNGTLTLRRSSIPMGSIVKLSPAASLILPLDDDARDRQSLVLGIKLSPRFLFDLEKLGVDFLSGHYQPSLTRNLHQFKTATTGSSNRAWAASNWLKLDFALWRKLTFSTSFVHSFLWTYEGNRTNTFSISEEIAWDVADNISIAAGHSNSGNAVKANGLNSNIDIFDPNSSTVYGSVSFSY